MFATAGLTAAAVLGTCVSFGYTLALRHIYGAAYLAAVCLVAAVMAGAALHLPYVLAELETDVRSAIRLSIYFSIRRPLFTLWMMVCLALCGLVSWLYFPFFFLMPFLFHEFTKNGVYTNLREYTLGAGIYAPEEFALAYGNTDGAGSVSPVGETAPAQG